MPPNVFVEGRASFLSMVFLPATLMVAAFLSVGGLIGVVFLVVFFLTPGDTSPRALASVFWLVVPVYAASVWWIYFYANRGFRDDHLVVHRGGFRLKYGTQSCALSFTEVGQIEIARSATGSWDIIVTSVSGSRTTFTGCLFRFEPADLERFFDILEKERPGVLRGRPELTKPSRAEKAKFWLVPALGVLVAAVGVAAFAEEYVLKPYNESVRITKKLSRNYSDERGTGVEFELQTSSNTWPGLHVVDRLWERVNVGDVLQVSASPWLKRWRTVTITRNGETVQVGPGLARSLFQLSLFLLLGCTLVIVPFR